MIDSASGNKIKENKYKILRMSLLLGNGEDREETINNFEDAARDIDAMNDEVYIRELDNKFYDTLTLEDEEKKLAVLVDYIGGRADQRISLINDFANVTGFELTNLPPIKYYDRLDEYKNRLYYIREYLENTKKIETLNKEIEELESKLERTYANKEKAEERNQSDEKILLDKFKNIISRNSDFKDIDVDNIDNVLADVNVKVTESKKSLDIFNKSFSTLEEAGISYEEEQEYSSYVEGAKDSYYKNKEQEYLLTIYKLLISNESEYNKILYKRDTIHNILYERLNLRKELGIKENDVLADIYDLLDRQYKNIQNQKNDIDNIDILSRDINDKRDTVKELELDNQKVEILSLLKEFCIIDTYDDFSNHSSVNEENLGSYDQAIVSNDVDSTSYDIDSDMGSLSSFDDEKSVVVEKNEVDFPEVNNTVSNDSVSSDIFGSDVEEEKGVQNTIVDIKANQVVDVRDANNDNLADIITKANNVMKRVGKMLGVQIKEKEKIVSVENPVQEEENVKEDDGVSLDKDNQLESQNDKIIPVDANNLFLNNDVEASSADDETGNDDFWGTSFDDGGLSSLPDLPVSGDNNSNNFFANNEFPDLKFDFGSNDSEGQ